jgi:hypothetical protein
MQNSFPIIYPPMIMIKPMGDGHMAWAWPGGAKHFLTAEQVRAFLAAGRYAYVRETQLYNDGLNGWFEQGNAWQEFKKDHYSL